MVKLKYDTDKYEFKLRVSAWLWGGPIAYIHEKVPEYNLFDRKNDQSTACHKRFYEMYEEDPQLKEMYLQFLEEHIKPRFKETIIYQKVPTFRVHLPGNVAVGEFHKDREYRDEKWAKKVKEVNYFIPLTTASGTNTIWTESKEDKGDFKPMEAQYGEFYEWDASNLTHGNKVNETHQTRVSFDFRVIPKSRYIKSSHKSINTKIPFGIGGYYEEL